VLAKRAKKSKASCGSSPTPPPIIPIEGIIVPGSEGEDPTPLIKKP
jgi:hypothetical protein